jgi:hypothetical protein
MLVCVQFKLVVVVLQQQVALLVLVQQDQVMDLAVLVIPGCTPQLLTPAAAVALAD